MKKRLVSFLLCFLMLFSLCSTAYGVTIEYEDANGDRVRLNDFLDTKGHWAHDTILKCAEYGLVVGNQGKFMPNQPMTRGQFAVVIDRMLGLDTMAYNLYNDLPNDAYYRDSILKCVAAGYINGVSANQVNPNGYATREQVATIICRIFEIDTSYYGYTSFVDDAKISAWAKPSVAAVQRLGYMVGDNAKRFNPQSNITRAEVLTLINNIANTYIPKRDSSDLGDIFKGNFPTNIVTSRNISLVNSTVGRDLVLTQAASNVELQNTIIMGRLLVMGRSSIDLEKCTISQIYLVDGKSSVEGIDKNIREVYIANYASETSLDDYPERLVLEPGTRVRVDGIFYENTTNSTKIYYGLELKADLAAEQGYVVGGARISGAKFTQEFDNTIKVDNIKIVVGDSKIKEVGVLWLDQESDEDVIAPTYQNYDSKTVYKSNKIAEPFSIDVGTVCGTRAYRVYAVDEEGLFAYSETVTFTEYDFNINMKITDNDYPKKLDVELVMTGDSIPEIRNVRIVYDRYETYSENHKEMSMRLYRDDDAEYQPDENKYKRYTATIISDDERVNGETIYYPPTAFGYIITFVDGNVINRFPVLTEVVPQGAKPVTTLSLGSISLNNDRIIVDNSRLVTSYVAVQEVGVVYKESESESVTSPSNSSVGWTYLEGGYNIPSNDNYIFDSAIRISDIDKNTFIAPYVKTSGGYYYGSISKVVNNWKGDEGGPQIIGAIEATVLDDNTVVLKIPYKTKNALDIYADNAILTATKNGVTDSSLQGACIFDLDSVVNDYGDIIYVCLDNLSAKSEYSLSIRLEDNDGLFSNIVSVNFNTSNQVPITIKNKGLEAGLTKYEILLPNVHDYKVVAGCLVGNTASNVKIIEDSLSFYAYTNVFDNPSKYQLELACKYSVKEGSGAKHYYSFTRSINLH